MLRHLISIKNKRAVQNQIKTPVIKSSCEELLFKKNVQFSRYKNST